MGSFGGKKQKSKEERKAGQNEELELPKAHGLLALKRKGNTVAEVIGGSKKPLIRVTPCGYNPCLQPRGELRNVEAK